MDLKDGWRWKLVDESVNRGDGLSKTSMINQYYINDKQNKFNVRVFDSPGFGDTSGMKTDDNIT